MTMMTTQKWFLIMLLLVFDIGETTAATLAHTTTATTTTTNGDDFIIGTGIYDMTGPAAQINFAGYARTTQNGHGIHMRLRARAFIIGEKISSDDTRDNSGDDAAKKNHHHHDEVVTTKILEEMSSRSIETKEATFYQQLRRRFGWTNLFSHKEEEDDEERDPSSAEASLADPERTICFVSIEAVAGSDLLTLKVLERLEELLPEQSSGKKRLCHVENLSISGTHTHSAPGGFLQYALYQIPSLGFSEETMSTYVEGVAQAIFRAYNNLQEGSISVAQDLLFDANINRSPSSYLRNPQSERDEYAKEGNTDKTMLQLKFTSNVDNEPLGVVNWFPVHCTSMNYTNTLISSDNKGYASYLMEKHYNENGTLPGRGKFVAAFASTNLGDVSPNTKGPICIDTGLPCDFNTSTCNGRTEKCIASGPGKNMFESTEMIGRKQYDLAVSLFDNNNNNNNNNATMLSGEVSFRHSFIDMSNRNVTLRKTGEIVHTCSAALGYSFAAGTTDGPGDFDFTQGRNSSSPFWNMVIGFLGRPSQSQIECHKPKPILLDTGESTSPYDWDPNTIPISIFRIGNFFILNVPAEFTTMSGRRLRRAVKAVLEKKGVENPSITIAGISNSYTHYVATFEEYTAQRYEAASTLYGPHTLSAYIQEFERITNDLLDNKVSQTDKSPPDLSAKQISLVPPVELDTIGIGRKFGSVAIEPSKDKYVLGNDTVFVSFRSANPRNNQRIEGTFLSVDLLTDNGTWQTRYVDGDWCTRFYWKGNILLGTSFAEISWIIPTDTTQGVYRICHYGTRKKLFYDFEIAFFRAPDWMTSSFMGSFPGGLLLRAAKLAVSLSDALRQYLYKLNGGTRFADFSGCSKSFLVVGNEEV